MRPATKYTITWWRNWGRRYVEKVTCNLCGFTCGDVTTIKYHLRKVHPTEEAR